MPITFLRAGEKGIIGRIKGPLALRQYLQTLGFIRGEEISVIQSSGESIVLRVKGSRIALSKEMARRIWTMDKNGNPQCECPRRRRAGR